MYQKYLYVLLLLLCLKIDVLLAQYQMEHLDRSVVAIERDDGSVYIGWRLLQTDPENIGFHVYRDGVEINEDPIDSSTNLIDENGTTTSVYTVTPVIDGQEGKLSAPATVMTKNYHAIPLQTDLHYGGNHVGVGDLDGDGDYDFVVKRGSQDIDPSQGTVARNTFKLEGYTNDGTFMWRVDLGWNIRQGIWYSPVLVYDLDGDGKAEVIAKIGEVDEDLNGDGRIDYRTGPEKRILSGPEYVVIINGETGEIMAREDWIERGSVSSWGDDYGNRVNRNMMCVAYLDGERPSLIILRGTYTKMYADAWNWRDGQLTKLWRWYKPSGGGGFHNLRTGDIDDDGKDEIINGSIAIDDDGTQLWETGEGHGDRMHMTDIDPSRPGLEIWYVQEAPAGNGIHLTDARTGDAIWGISKSVVSGDIGRGLAADIDPEYKGLECWASQGKLYNCKGYPIGSRPSQCNMAIWWDGDVLRELLDGTFIQKFGGNRLLTASGSTGSRNAPMGYGDIFGDWREEVWYIANNNELRIYSTTIPTDRRFVTFMHDKDYRISVACEMVGYMQATQPSFYFGAEMDQSPKDTPPFEPVGLKGSAGQGYVQLEWKENAETDLAGYHVYRSETAGGPYAKVNSSLVIQTSFMDSSVANEITYYYVVSAVDVDNNESRYSAEISVTPTSIPETPFGLSAGIETDMVRLFWHSNSEKDVVGYHVYRSVELDSAGTKINTDIIKDTTFTDNDVTMGKTYYYSITAIDDVNNESPASKSFTAIPDIPIVLQAEDATFISGCRFRNYAFGYKGTGFVDFIDETGELLFSHINGREGGEHTLFMRYFQRTSGDKLIGILLVNDQRMIIRTYDSGASRRWRTDSLTINLKSGMQNTLTFQSPHGDLGNLDEITIVPEHYTFIGIQESSISTHNALYQNYPNPFNSATRIEYEVKEKCHILLTVHNSLGQHISTLVNNNQNAGKYVLHWQGTDDRGQTVPSGVYFYSMKSNTHFSARQKMLLLR